MNQNKALLNSNFCNETLSMKNAVETSFLEIGRRLNLIESEKLYEPNYDSFSEFCEELKWSQPTVSKIKNIYTVFVEQYNFSQSYLSSVGGWSVLSELLPFVKSKKDAKEWLHKAKLLRRDDLRKEIKEVKTGIPMISCDHSDSYKIKICRKCGDRIQEHEN